MPIHRGEAVADKDCGLRCNSLRRGCLALEQFAPRNQFLAAPLPTPPTQRPTAHRPEWPLSCRGPELRQDTMAPAFLTADWIAEQGRPPGGQGEGAAAEREEEFQSNDEEKASYGNGTTSLNDLSLC